MIEEILDITEMIETPSLKDQFPLFNEYPDLVYLDSAATTQKPQSVIDGIQQFYLKENANVHRGIYDMAAKTSQKYEHVRQKVAQLIHADEPNAVVYTSGTTGGINLVAQSFLLPRLEKGDEVVLTTMEHHANLIPWQMACHLKEAKLRIIPINQNGELDLGKFRDMLSPRTKMVAVVHISNTLGTINPIENIVEIVRGTTSNIPVLVDAAQSIAHYPIDVQALDLDFLVFSGHKMFGPTGVGILYGKANHLEVMSPIQFGGDMIRKVSFENATFAPYPQKFEAGTTNIAGVIGLGYAIDFIQSLDKKNVHYHLQTLKEVTTEKLSAINGLTIIGQAKRKSAILSFTMDNVHPHDIATFLGAENIAIRAGHHCTQPLMEYLGLPATARASFSVYNELEDIDRLVEGLKRIKAFFN